MTNAKEDTTQIIRAQRQSGSLTPEDRFERIEASIATLIEKLDVIIAKMGESFGSLTTLDRRITILERIIFGALSLAGAIFATAVVTFFVKGHA